MITPSGMRNEARSVFMPVRALMTAELPRMSMEVTTMFVNRPKQVKIMCAGLPHLARMISRKVWHVGARRLTSTAIMENKMTWIVAPAAYQNGPDMPYLNATLEDCNNVAAQVHWETMTEAVRPCLTVRPAVLKNSDVIGLPVRYCSR
jgi:hypothetical protein